MTGDRNPWRTIRPLLPALFVVLLLSGCSAWDNVSAYFNTYYNASRQYDEAVTEVWALPELKSAGGDPLVPFTVPAGAKTKFTAVIEKCSKLLQYHPESGLVDNSLMMIGMSYFYQADYQRAQRKFLELIDGYPDGSFAMEARLMLARTAFKMNERDRARDLSTQLLALAEEEGEDEIAAHAAGILGRLAYEDGQYEAARTYFEKLADGANNADLRSFAYLRVATIDSALGDYAPALDAYERAEETALNITAEYRGAIGAARMHSFLGEYDDALDRLDDMVSNTTFRDWHGEIALEVGHVLRRSGRLEDAIVQYRYVDTAFVRLEASGAALYTLGEIYETELYDFDSARVMYGKSRLALTPASLLSQPAVRRAEAMNKWWSLRREIARYDSVLAYMDSLDEAQRNAPPDTVATADTAQVVPDSLKTPAPVAVPTQAMLPRDTVTTRLAASMTELATVHFLSLDALDSAAYWYRRVLTEYPESRGAPRAMFALAELSARDTVEGAERADSLRYALIDRYPDSEFADVSRRILGLPAVESRRDTVGRMYAEGEALYLSGRYEEAVAEFREVVARYPATNEAARAQYAIGFIYENNMGLSDSAEAAYRELVKSFPRTTYATTVQPRLLEADQARKEMEAAMRRDSIEAARVRDSIATAQAQTLTDSTAGLKRSASDTLKVPPPTGVPQGEALPDSTGRPKDTPPGEEPPPVPQREEPAPIPPDEEPGRTPPDQTPPDTPPDQTPPDTPPDQTPPDTPPDQTPPDTPPDQTPPDTPPDQEPAPAPPGIGRGTLQ